MAAEQTLFAYRSMLLNVDTSESCAAWNSSNSYRGSIADHGSRTCLRMDLELSRRDHKRNAKRSGYDEES